MNETLAARDFILDFLRKELVGPSPLPPNVQSNGEEILRPQDPPRQRYGAGVLFPLRSQVPSHDETAEDEESSTDADSPEPAGILENPIDTDSQGGSDSTPETDREVNLANQFLPSAMGLSALVDVPDRLRVEVSAATYRQDDTHQSEGGRSGRKPWLRQPVKHTIEFQATELLGNRNTSLEEPVIEVDGKPTLVLHVISRPSERSDRARLITFTLINRLQSENQAPRNSDCFFQCGFGVSDADGQGCFLSYPERPNYTGDAEELSLQLLHLHRQTFAVGHGCAAEWDEPTDGRTTVVRTEVLPTYEVKPVLPNYVEGLDLNMNMLAHGDHDDALSLCNRLANAYDAWIADRKCEVASRLDLTPELTETALRNLENCRECLRRMREGIGLLGDDPEVIFAFRLMNEAMLMQQIHYEIARPWVNRSQHSRPWVNRSGLLLEQWYNLSDPEMEEALKDRISFRRFVGLGLQDDTPDHSTISRFRSGLAELGVSERLFKELEKQLQRRGLILKKWDIPSGGTRGKECERPRCGLDPEPPREAVSLWLQGACGGG